MLKFEELPKVNSNRWLSLENLPGEIWKEVPGYKDLLLVSNYARIMKLPRFRSPYKIILKQSIIGNYYAVCMTIHKQQVKLYVHNIVANAFLENNENKPCIDHIDTNRLNNIISNLKWVTHKENANNPLTKLHRSKRVAKYDKFGNLLCIYNSVQEASAENNISIPSISNVANNKTLKDGKGKYFKCQTAGGYVWSYI